MLVQAFALTVRSVPDARLLIAGDGPERNNLIELAEQAGVAASVTFLGHLLRNRWRRNLPRHGCRRCRLDGQNRLGWWPLKP